MIPDMAVRELVERYNFLPCGCGGKLLIRQEPCKTVYPCIHDAKCDTCGNTVNVRGTMYGGPFCAPYFVNPIDAIEYDDNNKPKLSMVRK